ncbi:MAG: peptide chain release factor 2 [Candidatus Omnitrophica bacterium]|nr:peptide chain release factor 2 [Candidatus Omnitrophota bacterium]
MREELIGKLEKLKVQFEKLRGYLDLASNLAEIKKLETQMSQSGFWDSPDQANRTIQSLKDIKRKIEPFRKLELDLKNIEELIQLSQAEDADILGQINSELAGIEENLNKLEIELLLSGREDHTSAFLSIHAGAGGTESCDWVSMLFRMYTRWAESNGFGLQVIDFLPGEEAGVKSVTMLIKGDYVYGQLQGENGVHRLVRISPFDANKRRHTSFASVEVLPEIDQEIKIEINEADLRIDVYRSSGAGGQHVNTTDSAVRITHLSTGIVVQCQNERSQIKNRVMAMKMLKSKLYELKLEKRRQEEEKQNQTKRKIEWGSQIRSYVMHPYSMVKDHRTGVETGNVTAVMDGRLDAFLEGYLRWQRGKI